MRRLSPFLLGLWFGVACHLSPARRCSQNSDCPSNVCDTSLGVCTTTSAPDASCPVVCAAWQACVQGQCVSSYSAIDIQTPLNGAFVGAAPVPVVAVLVLSPTGVRADPAGLSLSVDGGVKQSLTLARQDAGLYAGVWTPA